MFTLIDGVADMEYHEPIIPRLTDGQHEARKKEIARQMAESDLAEAKLRDIDAAIAEQNQKKETLAADHVAECEKLQAKLSKLEAEQVDAIVTRKDFPESKAEQRRTLALELHQRNARLATAIAEVDAVLAGLAEERRNVAVQITRPVLVLELVNASPPELRRRHRSVSITLEHARARLEAAREKQAAGVSSPWLTAEIEEATWLAESTQRHADELFQQILT